MKTIPNSIIQELSKIQKEFIWKTRNPKIKHDTLCKNYENGGFKNAKIMSKVVSLQCSWIKRLYDNNSHNWKVIPLYMITQFLFHFNLDVNPKKSINSHDIISKSSENGAATYRCHQYPIYNNLASHLVQ